jgi:hypothetical protein
MMYVNRHSSTATYWTQGGFSIMGLLSWAMLRVVSILTINVTDYLGGRVLSHVHFITRSADPAVGSVSAY